ncbi:PIG-L deacetylase family protein [Halogeometricum borinquense]|uniref:PIG-L deacetylase family protein n=1 Tax=Halogeometricum borinquense TaxID=60847 RepID=UPI001F5DC342|nr:hypothetical protein [Halogeometricum borinquense]
MSGRRRPKLATRVCGLERRFRLSNVDETRSVSFAHQKSSISDHRVTSRLVTDAYYMASLPLAQTDHEEWEPDNVYYFGKPTADEFDPEVFIDMSDQQEAKEEAILQHESQVEWLEEHGGVDAEFDGLVEGVRAQARTTGRTRGAEFAEGFVPLHKGTSEYLE